MGRPCPWAMSTPINRKRKFTELEYGSQLILRFLIEISGKISGFQQRFLGISPKVYEISTSVGPLRAHCITCSKVSSRPDHSHYTILDAPVVSCQHAWSIDQHADVHVYTVEAMPISIP